MPNFVCVIFIYMYIWLNLSQSKKKSSFNIVGYLWNIDMKKFNYFMFLLKSYTQSIEIWGRHGVVAIERCSKRLLHDDSISSLQSPFLF